MRELIACRGTRPLVAALLLRQQARVGEAMRSFISHQALTLLVDRSAFQRPAPHDDVRPVASYTVVACNRMDMSDTPRLGGDLWG